MQKKRIPWLMTFSLIIVFILFAICDFFLDIESIPLLSGAFTILLIISLLATIVGLVLVIKQTKKENKELAKIESIKAKDPIFIEKRAAEKQFRWYKIKLMIIPSIIYIAFMTIYILWAIGQNFEISDNKIGLIALIEILTTFFIPSVIIFLLSKTKNLRYLAYLLGLNIFFIRFFSLLNTYYGINILSSIGIGNWIFIYMSVWLRLYLEKRSEQK